MIHLLWENQVSIPFFSLQFTFRHKWTGLLVEPLPSEYRTLKKRNRYARMYSLKRNRYARMYSLKRNKYI